MRALLCILLAAAGGARAQSGPPPGGTLVGSVTDGAGPLAGATVALYADDAFVTGAATGPDGAFRLDGVPAATYRVRVSFVGYVADDRDGVAVQAGQTTDLGAVALAPDAAQLGEAVVSAERDLVEQRADRTVYNVGDQPVTAGGSALEALQTLPSIEVDTDGNLSLRGGQNVAVHLNGRPVPVRGAQLAALLRQIPARTVARVEVMPNPSAKYEPDGMSGIVNLVLKETTDRGLSGGLTLGGGTAPNGEAGGNVAYQRGRLDATASYGYRYDGFGLDGTSTRVQRAGVGTTTVEQSLGLDDGTGSHLATGTLDVTLAEGTTLGASGTLGLRDGTADQAVGFVFDPGTAAESGFSRRTDGDTGGTTADAALTFRQSAGAGRQTTAEARWTRNDDDRDERFTDAFGLYDLHARNRTDDRVDEASLQLDHARPLAGVQVEVGAKGTARQIGASRAYARGLDAVPDPGRSGAFSYDESVVAAYAQASRAFGALQLQGGLRAEVARRDVTVLDDVAPITDRATTLYPSAFALYTFAPGTTLKASTSRRVNRPNAQFLNPTPRFQDTLIVDVGNPTLRPEYTTAYELAVQVRHVLTVTPFYRHTTDVIRRRITFDPVSGLSKGTFQNLDTQDSYGADVTLAPRIGPVRGVLAGSVYRSVTDGGRVEAGLASDGLVYTLRGSLQAEVRPGTTVQAFGFYRGPLETEDAHVSAFGLASLGLSHKIGDRLQLAARVNDVLGTARFTFESEADGVRFVGVRAPQIRQATATLTYTFGRQGPPRRARTPQPQQGGGLDGVGF